MVQYLHFRILEFPLNIDSWLGWLGADYDRWMHSCPVPVGSRQNSVEKSGLEGAQHHLLRSLLYNSKIHLSTKNLKLL